MTYSERVEDLSYPSNNCLALDMKRNCIFYVTAISYIAVCDVAK